MCQSLRFKTPLLRGEPNTQLDQFKKIEALISSDLDHWLCNLYFQVCICVCIRNIHACTLQMRSNKILIFFSCYIPKCVHKSWF